MHVTVVSHEQELFLKSTSSSSSSSSSSSEVRSESCRTSTAGGMTLISQKRERKGSQKPSAFRNFVGSSDGAAAMLGKLLERERKEREREREREVY